MRSTIWRMVRTPDTGIVREASITTRMTTPDVADMDSQRRERGGMSRSGYIRWLIREDKKRINREKGRQS